MKKKIDLADTESETNSDLTNLNKRNSNEIKLSSLPNSFLPSTAATSRAFDLSKVGGSLLGPTAATSRAFDLSKVGGSLLGPTAATSRAFDLSKVGGSLLGPTAATSRAFDLSKVGGSLLGPTAATSHAFDLSKVGGSLLGPTAATSRAFDLSKVKVSIPNGLTSFQMSLSKLPKTYQIEKLSYAKENKNNGRAIVKNLKNNDSVPVDSLASTMATIDIIKDLTADEVFSFYNHLIKYPLLGLEHEVGRKILDEIAKQNLIKVSNMNLFRARERDIEEREMPYNELEMFEAPYGIAGHGRFNVHGQGELYTCENEEVALKEINALDHKSKRYEVAEWKLLQEVRMLDLTNKESDLVKFCLYKKISNNAQEYILPNFLAQCAKYHNINGIKVSSTIDNSCFNYIFFDFEKRWFKLNSLRHDIKFK